MPVTVTFDLEDVLSAGGGAAEPVGGTFDLEDVLATGGGAAEPVGEIPRTLEALQLPAIG